MANEAGSNEYEEDYNEDSEAYGDYQGSEEYQYHYDGDDYPSYEEGYSEEQVCWENCAAVYFKRATSKNENEGLKFEMSPCTWKSCPCSETVGRENAWHYFNFAI